MQINKLDPPNAAPNVVLQGTAVAFCAPQGLTILQAAERAGVDLPNSCRNGTCRTCLCKVLQGTYQCQIEWPGLSAEEKSQGFCLPCVTVALSSLVIALP